MTSVRFFNAERNRACQSPSCSLVFTNTKKQASSPILSGSTIATSRRIMPSSFSRFAQRRLHLSAPDSCCQLRKVSVLYRHLRMNDAWISGQRRAQVSTRSSVSVVEVDGARGKLKFNPLANWSQSDVAAYKARYELPDHPLTTKG